jgi:hypothetical protein
LILLIKKVKIALKLEHRNTCMSLRKTSHNFSPLAMKIETSEVCLGETAQCQI